jgi:integration host factor subunit beta
MATITKQELVNRIAKQTHYKLATVKAVVQQLLNQITLELAKNNRLEFRNFGVFEPWTREARTAQNPRTLEFINVPAKPVVRFKMGRIMRESMNLAKQQEASRMERPGQPEHPSNSR